MRRYLFLAVLIAVATTVFLSLAGEPAPAARAAEISVGITVVGQPVPSSSADKSDDRGTSVLASIFATAPVNYTGSLMLLTLVAVVVLPRRYRLRRRRAAA